VNPASIIGVDGGEPAPREFDQINTVDFPTPDIPVTKIAA
jgi:hypothetical protein